MSRHVTGVTWVSHADMGRETNQVKKTASVKCLELEQHAWCDSDGKGGSMLVVMRGWGGEQEPEENSSSGQGKESGLYSQ